MVFKAYDIRGEYGVDITEELFANIGKCIGNLGNVSKIVIGRDMRNSSPKLKQALIEGIQESGIDVIDLDLASTPMLYHATNKLDVDMGIIITASHNPSKDNGMKLCWKNAIPIAWDSGISELKEFVENKNFFSSEKKGEYSFYDFKQDYVEDLKSYLNPSRKLKIVVDAGNGMGGFVDTSILENGAEVQELYCDLDGNFPNHEANPIKEETLDDLKEEVVKNNLDVGFAIDGDADRVGIVDEKGNFVTADLLAAFLIDNYIEKFPREDVYSYDLRSSKVVKDTIVKGGKTPIQTRVGHSFIKESMRHSGSFFSSELSGHYYFWFGDDIVYDSALRTIIEVVNILSEKDMSLSEIVEKYRQYYKSAETNFSVSDKQRVFDELNKEFSDANIANIDGVTFDYDNWWFNIRASNTENKIRLNLEADTKELFDENFLKVSNFIEEISQ